MTRSTHPCEIIQRLIHLLVKNRSRLHDGALSSEGHLLCLAPESRHVNELLRIRTSALQVKDKVDKGIHLPAQPVAALFMPVDRLGVIHEVVDELFKIFRQLDPIDPVPFLGLLHQFGDRIHRIRAVNKEQDQVPQHTPCMAELLPNELVSIPQ